MQHYFVPVIINNEVQFYPDDEHHILHVMRMRDQAKIVVIYQQKKYQARLAIQPKQPLKAIIDKALPDNTELPKKLILIYSMPKKEKFELVLQKATELGVHLIVPLLSKRSLITLDNWSHKKQRYERILKEAAEQAQRNMIPLLADPIENHQIPQYCSDSNFVAYEALAGENKQISFDIGQTDANSLSILIGCEGGFEQQEIEMYKSFGFTPIALGKRILRSETAAIYLLSVISFLLESRM